MTGEQIARIIILTAAVVTAVGVLWRKVVKPAWGAVVEVVTTIREIRSEFSPNHGSSLRDSSDRNEAETKATRGEVAGLRTELSEVRAELAELHAYAHDWKHDQEGRIAGLLARDEAITRRLDDLKANDVVKIEKLDRIAAVASAADVQMAEHRESED